MTMDDTDDEYEAVSQPPARITLWLVIGIVMMFWRNIFDAFRIFYEDLADALVSHSRFKNERKTFSDSVMADIGKL